MAVVESLSSSCWSDRYVLKLDGRPWGEYCGRWFSEAIDVNLTARRQLRLERTGWLGSRFLLTDTSDAQRLGEAERIVAFRVAWDLRLSGGTARLVSSGWLNGDSSQFNRSRRKRETRMYCHELLGLAIDPAQLPSATATARIAAQYGNYLAHVMVESDDWSADKRFFVGYDFLGGGWGFVDLKEHRTCCFCYWMLPS